jgi:hypothetical protein
MLTNAAQVQNIIKILQKSQPLVQFAPHIPFCHFSQSLTHVQHLSHLFTLIEVTTRDIVKTLASNMEALMPVINLRGLLTVGHAVVQLVEALRYKPEDRRFDSRWCHWDF